MEGPGNGQHGAIHSLSSAWQKAPGNGLSSDKVETATALSSSKYVLSPNGCALAEDLLQCKGRVTESQNGLDWMGPLKII